MPYLSAVNQRVPLVSNWSSGQHIEHLYKAYKEIYAELLKGEKHFPTRGWLLKYFILFTGFIPRGKGQAPDFSLPQKQDYSAETLDTLIEDCDQLQIKIFELPESVYIHHPILGKLSKKQTIRFLEIHDHHHIKIMKQVSEAL